MIANIFACLSIRRPIYLPARTHVLVGIIVSLSVHFFGFPERRSIYVRLCIHPCLRFRPLAAHLLFGFYVRLTVQLFITRNFDV